MSNNFVEYGYIKNVRESDNNGSSNDDECALVTMTKELFESVYNSFCVIINASFFMCLNHGDSDDDDDSDESDTDTQALMDDTYSDDSDTYSDDSDTYSDDSDTYSDSDDSDSDDSDTDTYSDVNNDSDSDTDVDSDSDSDDDSFNDHINVPPLVDTDDVDELSGNIVVSGSNSSSDSENDKEINEFLRVGQ